MENNKICQIECQNCGEHINIPDNVFLGEDYWFEECPDCGCEVEIDIEYDDEGNIVACHVY